MVMYATIKETTNPTPKTKKFASVKSLQCLSKSYAVVAHITGSANKKENSALALRFRPTNMAPIIVDPARLVPGIRAAIWAKPISKACLQEIFSISER